MPKDDFIIIEYIDAPRVTTRVDKAKVTDATMTCHEFARLLCWRARQLKVGVPPVIKWNGRFDPIAIAREEINQRVIPLVIVRMIPDGSAPTGFREEHWHVKDMNIRDA